MAVKDRLQELHRAARPAADAPAPDPPPDPEVEALYNEVQAVEAELCAVRAGAAAVRRLHAAPAFHASHDMQQELEQNASAAQAAALRALTALRALEARAARRTPTAAPAARERMARLQYAAARARYAAALHALHAALSALRGERLRLLQEQGRLTNLEITDEECENLLDSRNLSLFVDNLQAETAEARLALREAEARRADLERLERALGDVRDLFAHLHTLVAAQQDQIDSVEYYALQASEHVELGQRTLLRGAVHRTRARKKKMGLLICLAAGAAVVLLVLVFT